MQSSKSVKIDKEKSDTAIESLQSQLNCKEKEIELYKKKLEEKEKENEQLKKQLFTNESNHSNIQKQLSTNESNHDNIQKQLSTNESNHDNIQKQLSTNESSYDSYKIQFLNEDEINDFEKLEEISYNQNGKVVKVAKKQIFVLKIMNAKNSNFQALKLFLNEYEIMNMLNHPNIIKTFGICLNSTAMPPTILIEFCISNFEEMILKQKYTKVDIAFAIYQIVEGMKYVHYKKIIHRDLKPTNILIASDGTIRIADFGISKLKSPDEKNTLGIGTQKFMAPELLNEEDYDEKVDVYSFGVVAYFALNNGEMPVTKMRHVMNGIKTEIPSSFTSFAKNLIDSCWNFDPKDRPSFNAISEQLNENCHSLFDLSSIEIMQLNEKIRNHKLRIPVYNNIEHK